jgi:hypothetical protein
LRIQKPSFRRKTESIDPQQSRIPIFMGMTPLFGLFDAQPVRSQTGIGATKPPAH